MLGSNIKVHFAGTDYDIECINALKLAEVKYRLFTVYYAIANKKIGDDFTDISGVCKQQQKIFNHVIMDSGLFTLMFGSGKGQQQTKETLLLWQDKTFEFIKQNNLNCSCVEIDCQKILSPKDAWFFRERMKNKIGDSNKCINVFHYEDGQDGLNSLIDFSEYIAISVPEIRIIHPKTFREDVHRLACYIKNKKPQIDIHLLGCTDKKMLSQNKFCTSADSSSWTGVYRYATIQGKSIYNLKKEKYEEYKKKYIQFVGESYYLSLSKKRQRNSVWQYISAELHKNIYTKYAGKQD